MSIDSYRSYKDMLTKMDRKIQYAIRSSNSSAAIDLARRSEELRDEIQEASGSGDTRSPAAPVEIVLQSAVHTLADGSKRGDISATFQPVTLATDGTEIQVSRYEMWGRDITGIADAEDYPSFDVMAVSADPSIMATDLRPGTEWEVKFRALASTSPNPGVFSAVNAITVERDTTPPPIPSDLVLSQKFLTVRGQWDKLSAVGEPMPLDFRHCEVAWAMGDDSPTEVKAMVTENAPFVITDDTEAGVPLFMRHRAVDSSGNKSSWSAVQQVTPEPVVDDDSIQAEVDRIEEELSQGLDETEMALREEMVTSSGTRVINSTEDAGSGNFAWPPRVRLIGGASTRVYAPRDSSNSNAGYAHQEVVGGETYRFSINHLVGDGEAGAFSISFIQRDQNFDLVYNPGVDFPASASDTRVETDVYVSPSARYLMLSISSDSTSAGAGLSEPSLKMVKDDGGLGREVFFDPLMSQGSLWDTVYNSEYVSAPAEEGTIWQKWTSLGDQGRLLKSWTLRDGSWEEGSLDETYIPKIHIGDGTYNQLRGDRLVANTVTAEKVLVGGENLFPNAGLTRGPRDDGSIPFWDDGAAGPGWTRGDVAEAFAQYDLRTDGADGQQNYETGTFAIEGGEQYRLSVRVNANKLGSTYAIRLVTDSNGDEPSPLLPNQGGNTIPGAFEDWRDHESVFTVPDGATEAFLRIHTNSGVGSDVQDAIQRFAGWSLRKMTGSSLVVNGAIVTNKLGALAVTAEKIDALAITSDKIAANAITAGKIAAGSVEAQMLTADAIDGKVITGATVRTSSNWASAGGAILRSDGTDGHIVAVDSSGNIKARLGGDQNYLHGLDVIGQFSTNRGFSSGLVISEGTVTYWSHENETWRAVDSSYIRFPAGSYDRNADPLIFSSNQNLIIAPGAYTSSDRRSVYVDGRLEAEGLDVTNRIDSPNIWASDGNSHASHSGTGFRLHHDNSGMNLGITRESYHEMALNGQIPSAHSPTSMFVCGSRGWLNAPPGHYQSGSITYGAPAFTGNRWPHVTGSVSSGSQDASRSIIVSSSSASASGFEWTSQAPMNNQGDVSYRILFMSRWGGD